MNIKTLSIKYFNNDENLNLYLKEIRRFKVLTPIEENEAFMMYRQGDKSARERIINSNQRFVFSLAKRYAKDETEVLDYVNEGNIGLIEAVETFDATKGFKFITYAVNYIRRSMNYYLTVTNNIVRRTNSMKIGKKVEHIKDKILCERGEIPSDEEVVDLLRDIYNVKINDMSDISSIYIESISDEVTDGYAVEETSDFNIMTASVSLYEDKLEKEDMLYRINSMLKDIDEKAPQVSEVIRLYYGIGCEYPHSIEQLSLLTGICPEDVTLWVKQVHIYLKDNYGRKLVV